MDFVYGALDTDVKREARTDGERGLSMDGRVERRQGNAAHTHRRAKAAPDLLAPHLSRSVTRRAQLGRIREARVVSLVALPHPAQISASFGMGSPQILQRRAMRRSFISPLARGLKVACDSLPASAQYGQVLFRYIDRRQLVFFDPVQRKLRHR